MSRVLHANCFPSSYARADVLLTDETLVADAAPRELRTISGEALIDDALAHRTSVEMARAAFEWFRIEGDDPSIVAGVSAGDLCGAEAAVSVLMPVARAVLSMSAALDHGIEPSTIACVAPAGDGRYDRLERLAADAGIAAARARLGSSLLVERIASGDPRNRWLREKYAVVRDPDYLTRSGMFRTLTRRALLGLANVHGRLRIRRHHALLVLEYNPTHAFARAYGARRERRWRLVCWPAAPRDLLAIARAGDEAILPLAPDLARQASSEVGERLRDRAGELDGSSLRVAGVELWPIVREPLFEMAERYGRYAASLAGPIARELERREVRAVLVPFDSPAHARLIVRVAQAMGVPTFVTSDGYKADEIQQEGMAADVALAWSAAMRDCYFARRPTPATVTGNPRVERLRRIDSRHGARLRVLVGGHTFSPIDLNCRRSDPERFLEQALEGIARSPRHVGKEVLVKLHSSDPQLHYRAIVKRYPQLRTELRNHGDVIELFHDFDVYLTTYSTSLLEAVAVGLPIIYYQVNPQRMGPPFSDDQFLAGRTARTPIELATLLADPASLASPPPDGWIEQYIGPTTGAVDRILSAIEQHTALGLPAVGAGALA